MNVSSRFAGREAARRVDRVKCEVIGNHLAARMIRCRRQAQRSPLRKTNPNAGLLTMKPLPSASNHRYCARFVAFCLGLALLGSGCTSTRFVSTAGSTDLTTRIHPGDRVDCRMPDGTTKSFVVTAVEPAAVVGDSIRLSTAEISYIEVTGFDGKKTLKAAGGVAVIAGLVAVVAATHGGVLTLAGGGFPPIR